MGMKRGNEEDLSLPGVVGNLAKKIRRNGIIKVTDEPAIAFFQEFPSDFRLVLRVSVGRLRHPRDADLAPEKTKT